jgi:hypothetical protein
MRIEYSKYNFCSGLKITHTLVCWVWLAKTVKPFKNEIMKIDYSEFKNLNKI